MVNRYSVSFRDLGSSGCRSSCRCSSTRAGSGELSDARLLRAVLVASTHVDSVRDVMTVRIRLSFNGFVDLFFSPKYNFYFFGFHSVIVGYFERMKLLASMYVWLSLCVRLCV